jgi:hypothetical protein
VCVLLYVDVASHIELSLTLFSGVKHYSLASETSFLKYSIISENMTEVLWKREGGNGGGAPGTF